MSRFLKIFNDMNEMLLKERVRSIIFDVLREQTEGESSGETPTDRPRTGRRKKKKAAPGEIRIADRAVGSGRFKKFVEEANARATKDARGLMKDLGIRTAARGSDLDQVEKILKSAIHVHPLMRQSYGGVKKVPVVLPNGEQSEAVGIFLAQLDSRNGIKFLSHTLNGAKNAGFLNLQGALELGKGQKAPIVIYST